MRTIEDQIKDRDFETLRNEFMASNASDYHRQLVLFSLLLEILKQQEKGR